MRQSIPTNENIIPENIRLPDGRLFSVKELLTFKRNYKSHKIGNTARFYYHTPEVKESKEAKNQAITKMKLREVMETYRISKQQAWAKITYSCRALGMPRPRREDYE